MFQCKTLEDFHNIYLELDTVLLADVFERFRSDSMGVYKLDPSHFCTSPSLSWHACLKFTKVTLDILTDPNMNLFIDGMILINTTGFIPLLYIISRSFLGWGF